MQQNIIIYTQYVYCPGEKRSYFLLTIIFISHKLYCHLRHTHTNAHTLNMVSNCNEMNEEEKECHKFILICVCVRIKDSIVFCF